VSYLLYCILRQPPRRRPQTRTLVGVAGQPVILVGHWGLGAVLSPLGPEELAARIPELLAYERVVESFHQAGTVIPMRYGCVFEDPAQVLHLLQERRWQYLSLLQDLEGCVEMGIRLLLPAEAGASEPARALSGPPAAAATLAQGAVSLRPGQSYLAAQRERYAARDREPWSGALLPDKLCQALAGAFMRHRRECRRLGDRLLVSLYFLVPRNRLPLFRRSFRQISAGKSWKLLLSGPWPPYNFVALSPLDLYPPTLSPPKL
jgi:hypothetical protein